jgi:hypothetical protein
VLENLKWECYIKLRANLHRSSDFKYQFSIDVFPIDCTVYRHPFSVFPTDDPVTIPDFELKYGFENS